MTKVTEATGADGTSLPNPDNAYEQGRTARLGGIDKDNAPYDKEDPKLKEWLKGWKFEDKEPESYTTEEGPAEN